jgi:glycosyltransferase involved in cell wall biosynthesis
VKVAVLTLCRDRLDYTQHCFQTLRDNAGCDFDHFVLDQGSSDDTAGWLLTEQAAGRVRSVYLTGENIGCTRGWNTLLRVCRPEFYDVIVCFDNDCEVITKNTLQAVGHAAYAHKEILAPRVLGLLHPPPTISRFRLGPNLIDETTILGNIFMAIPSSLLAWGGFRWDERYAVWDGGESITAWHRDRGGRCGYVQGFYVNHYKTTLGQVEDIPWYFERRVHEGGRPR